MSVTKQYRQTPTGDRYTITFEQTTEGYFKMHCSEHPFDPYDKGVHENHLYSSGQICVSAGKEPRTMDRAQAIVAAFIDGYSDYVRTGTFPKVNRRYNV